MTLNLNYGPACACISIGEQKLIIMFFKRLPLNSFFALQAFWNFDRSRVLAERDGKFWTADVTMNNPNHPLYNALGGNSNIHLLDNMLFSTDQHKPSLIPQYAAYPMETLAAHQVGFYSFWTP